MTRARLLPTHLTAPASAEPATNAGDLKEDTIYGAEAIRDFLGLPKLKQVYRLREHGKAPLFYMDGVGLAASKSALRAWYKRMVDAANDPAATARRGLAKPR